MEKGQEEIQMKRKNKNFLSGRESCAEPRLVLTTSAWDPLCESFTLPWKHKLDKYGLVSSEIQQLSRLHD